MKIEHDEVNDITYIDFELADEIDHTVVLYEDGLNIDLTSAGNVKGIEILNSEYLQRAIKTLYNIEQVMNERYVE